MCGSHGALRWHNVVVVSWSPEVAQLWWWCHGPLRWHSCGGGVMVP